MENGFFKYIKFRNSYTTYKKNNYNFLLKVPITASVKWCMILMVNGAKTVFTYLSIIFTMDPDEVEFLAEKQLIRIVPNFNCNVIHFISGDVGPFKGGLPCTVPLWLAVNLKQQQKCIIVAPDWMNVDVLEDLLATEKNSKNFTAMPSEHYMVEAKLVLGCAADDITRSDEIRTIIKDIWDTRMSKIRTSMDGLVKEGGSYAALDNLTMMEINAARPLLPHALDQLYRIRATHAAGVHSQNTTLSLNNSSRS